MKSWQDVLRENTYNDESFQLESDNDAYIIGVVLDSYKGAPNDYTPYKPIFDASYQAGYKLVQRGNGDEINYVLSKDFGSASIIFEFTFNDGYLLKAYITDNNEIVKSFSQIYNNYDFKRPLDDLIVNLRISPTADPAIYVGTRKDYITYFKFMYLFMKTMINKLKLNETTQKVDLVENVDAWENTAFKTLIDQFTTMVLKIKDKYKIDLDINNVLDSQAKEYKVSIKWVDGYLDAPPEVQEKLIKCIDVLSNEVKKLNGAFDQITVKSFDRFIKTLIIKNV